MHKKGNEFKGIVGGKNYERWAAVFGMNKSFYRKSIGTLALPKGAKVLDLGCGPGGLSFALAEQVDETTKITGIDISNDQLHRARQQADHYKCRLSFQNRSMDQLPFSENYFDLVMSSMALHETPPEIRRAAIAEIARVLKDNGRFLFVDWSKPRLGLWGLIWMPMICSGTQNKDNWNNSYPHLCAAHGLLVIEDDYINSIVRRQLFGKNSSGNLGQEN